jgi:hypothetical protein
VICLSLGRSSAIPSVRFVVNELALLCHFEVKEQSPTARVSKLKTNLEVRPNQLHDDLLGVSFVRRLYRHGKVLLRVDLLNLAT